MRNRRLPCPRRTLHAVNEARCQGAALSLVLVGGALLSCWLAGCASASSLDIAVGGTPDRVPDAAAPDGAADAAAPDQLSDGAAPDRDADAAPPAFICSESPITYRSAGAAPGHPEGPCQRGPGCVYRTREICDNGTVGVTTAYDCVCYPDDYPSTGWSWQCPMYWRTTASCEGDGGRPLPGAGTGTYWIRVEGDGSPYDLSFLPLFYPMSDCGGASLGGCYRSATPPCLSTLALPLDTGVYYDRNGDAWNLTVTSAEPDPRTIWWQPAADGVLQADAAGAGGATMHLTFTYHAENAGVRFCDM